MPKFALRYHKMLLKIAILAEKYYFCVGEVILLFCKFATGKVCNRKFFNLYPNTLIYVVKIQNGGSCAQSSSRRC